MNNKKDKVKYTILPDSDKASTPAGKKRGARPKALALEGKSEQEIDEIEHQMVRDKELAVIDEKYGEGLKYDAIRVVGEIHVLVAQTKQAFLEIGRRLILLKEHEGHGQFMAKLEELNFPYKSAQRMMRCALVVDSLGGKKDILSILNQGKLLEIATLEEGEIKELGEGGSVAGAYLDDLARMSFDELQAYTKGLRQKHKDEIEARERIIKEKNDKLDELDRELRGLPQKSQKDVNKAMLNELQLRFVARCSEITSIMSELRDVLDEAARLPEIDALQLSPFQNEIVRLGTENVAEDWEALCAVLEDYRPILDEDDDVSRMG